MKEKVKGMADIMMKIEDVVKKIKKCLTEKCLGLMECKVIGSKHLIAYISQ